jgi:serine/threonine-protein kinase
VSLEQARLLEETTAALERSREEMKRLSQRISSGGVGSPQATPEGGLDRTAAAITTSRYQVVAPLGEGGMARVFVAQTRGAEGFRRLFVVKRLRPELTGNAEIVSQFIDEARLGASFVHSNIVPVFDFGRDAEGYFIAQEYILGRDVDAVIEASKARRGRPLEAGVVLAIAQDALKALSYAHTRQDEAGRRLGLVHRDVSPNNLLLSARGEVKLLDFGIIKADQRLTRTQTGVVKGNLFFMSPEQARADQVDARSDLFSLGLVLFTAVTGQTLYDGITNFELLTRSAQGPTEADFRRIDSQVPPRLAPIIRKAVQPQPAQRFADAEEFGRAVAAAGGLASSTDLQALMEALFKDELSAEMTRFAFSP